MRPSINTTIAFTALVFTSPSFADFVPGPGPITGTVGAQSLATGTGTINAGGAISIASGGTVPLTMTGTSTLINNGTLQTLGTGRAIDSNSGTANLTVTNNGLISSVSADAFRVNTAGTSVSLTNSGTIRVTNGGQAIDWAAITTGSNTLNNLFGGVISAVGEDAARPGANGTVTNAGTISATPTGTTSPSGSDGIQANSSGVVVTNSGSISGRHGITGGAAGFSITVNNNAGTISAVNGSGINIDDLASAAIVTNAAGATIKGGVLVAATEGDGDGVDVDGVLTLNNSGDILGLGAKGGTSPGNNAEAVAAGGGSITNNATGRIIGSTLTTGPFAAPNGDVSRAGNGILIDDSNGGNAVAATTVTNGGLIQGLTGFGIKMVGTFDDYIHNSAGGTIQGAGTGATIQTGGGNDRVDNEGAIVSETGNAIDLGDGDDDLWVYDNGGLVAPSIVGNVSGGTGHNSAVFNPGNFNIAYAGVLSNFSNVSIIDVLDHGVTFSGANTYTGVTNLVSGTLILDGVNRISSSSQLLMQGGNLVLENAGGPNGQTFAGLVLYADAIIDLGQSSLTFGSLDYVAAGAAFSVLNFYAVTSPDYAFRFTGDYSANESFLTLIGQTTINGLAAIFNFDGTYTNVLTAVPVPIPAAWMLLASGLTLLGAFRRRRKQLFSGGFAPA